MGLCISRGITSELQRYSTFFMHVVLDHLFEFYISPCESLSAFISFLSLFLFLLLLVLLLFVARYKTSIRMWELVVVLGHCGGVR